MSGKNKLFRKIGRSTKDVSTRVEDTELTPESEVETKEVQEGQGVNIEGLSYQEMYDLAKEQGLNYSKMPSKKTLIADLAEFK